MLPADNRLPRRRRQLNAVRLTPGQCKLLNVEQQIEDNGKGMSSGQSNDDDGHIKAARPTQFPSTEAEQIPVRQPTARSQRGGKVSTEQGEGAWSMLQRSLKKIADNGVVPAGIGATVVDKSVDAVKDLGRAAVEMANTLDTAIEHLIGSWSAPWSTEITPRSAKKAGKEDEVGEGHLLVQRANLENAHKRIPLQDLTNSGRARVAMQAPREVMKSKSSGAGGRPLGENLGHAVAEGPIACNATVTTPLAEKTRLREHLQKLREDVKRYSKKCSSLAEENRRLREGGSHPTDVLDDQVRAQVEALLAEKARLAQENARLLRENGGLQELLQFTMGSQLDPMEDESGSNISGEDWDSGFEADPPAGVQLACAAPAATAKNATCSQQLVAGQPSPPKTPVCGFEGVRRTVTPL